MTDLILERAAFCAPAMPDMSWVRYGNRTYELRVILIPQESGYAVSVKRLPGVHSQGETEEEALANIRDAFQAVAQEYLHESASIPWCNDDYERPVGTLERWILVDV